MTVARKPELSFLLDKVFANASAGMHVAIPAQVKAYNASNSDLNGLATVDAQPVCHGTLREEDREAEDQFPTISSVPLIFPGSGPYRLTFPIAVGDYVLLVFMDRSTDEFVANGGVNVPQDLRTHHIADAFAIPGVTPGPNALTSVSTNVMVLGKNGNSHQPAARKNDGVGNGTLAFTHVPASGAGVTPCSMSVVYTPGDGSAPTSLATGNGSLTVKEKITGGSSDVEIT